jgi:outer membrane protein TolC
MPPSSSRRTPRTTSPGFALEHRLDARAAQVEAEAAAKRVGLAWSSVVPVVSRSST